MHVGRKIRLARKAKGWTQTELAEAVGTSQRAISEIESGKAPVRIEMVAGFAQALECPRDELTAWGLPEDEGSPQGPGSMYEGFVLPVRGTVNLSKFKWPETGTTSPEVFPVPKTLYAPQRFALRAADDSMSPEIRNQDICIFDPMIPIAPGSVACCQIKAEKSEACLVRWYLETEDAVILQPDKAYDPQVQALAFVKKRAGKFKYQGDEVELNVLGVLVGLFRGYAVPI